MKVLVAFDGSAPASTAVEAVKALDLPEGSLIQLLTVIPDEAELMGGPWSSVVMLEPANIEAQRRTMGARLDEIAADLRTGTASVQSCVVPGRPATEIVAAADRFGADLIVVGARGQRRLERLLIGSVSSEVVDQAHCPVLVARTDHLGRVLVAVDGSVDHDRIAAFAALAPVLGPSSLRVLSVVETGFPWWAGMSPVDAVVAAQTYELATDAARIRAGAATEATRDGLAAALAPGCELSASATEPAGDTGSTIVAEASRWGADLVMLGMHDDGSIHRTLVGSTSRHVLHAATMSVLIVRPPAPVHAVSPAGHD